MLFRSHLYQLSTHAVGPFIDQLVLTLLDGFSEKPAKMQEKSAATIRQVIRKLARGNPQARIVVMGCYATRAPSELWRLPGVVEVVTDKRELPDLLGRFGVVEPSWSTACLYTNE